MDWFMVKLELNYSDMICKPKFKKKSGKNACLVCFKPDCLQGVELRK